MLDLSNAPRWTWHFYGGCLVLAPIVGLIVYTGHGPHALRLLPLMLVAACPLMHVFMHGRHRKK